MLRFTPGDNAIAADHFRSAIQLDEEFARAHAGLSLTHWQNGFMSYGGDRTEHQKCAKQSAEQALRFDHNDPFVNFNMSRALWLAGDLDGAHHWLDRGIELNPSYAHCYHTNSIIHLLDGHPDLAAECSDKAKSLSPLDPLAYGFYGTRALSAALEGDLDTVKENAARAVRLPGMHYNVTFLAALSHELLGDRPGALAYARRGLRENPNYRSSSFLGAMPFRDPTFRQMVRKSLQSLGLPE